MISTIVHFGVFFDKFFHIYVKKVELIELLKGNETNPNPKTQPETLTLKP